MTTKKRIKKAIKYYRECCTYLREILDFCDLNGYNYAFVGGFIRWCLDENFESTGPRDLDVIIDMPKEELLWFLESKKIKFRKNNCGGCKVFPHYDDYYKKELDVWTLDAHQPFIPFEHTVEYRNIKRTFKNVAETSWLSTDGAIYDVGKNRLYAKACKKSLEEKCVRFRHYDIYKESPYVEFRVGIVAKILKLIHDGWSFDENCLSILVDYFNKRDETKLVRYMEKHYANQFIDWHYEVIKYKNLFSKKS